MPGVYQIIRKQERTIQYSQGWALHLIRDCHLGILSLLLPLRPYSPLERSDWSTAVLAWVRYKQRIPLEMTVIS